MYFILAWAIIGAASAVCGPETCAVVGLSLPLQCKGTVIKNGGYCGCFDVCAKQAGESCQARPGLDGRVTYGTCEPDLICEPHGEMVSLGYGRCHIPRTPRILTALSHNTPCEQMRRARLLSMAVWQGEWTPVCDALGNFHANQCDNIGQCFCVETLSGKILTAKTLGAVDCSTQPEVTPEVTTTMTPTKAPAARLLDFPDFPDMSHTSCEQQRRARLMSMVVWQGQWVPVCDSQGNYLPHQCDNMGQCFCVETLSGKILTAKTLGAVDCSTQPEVTPEVTTTMTPTKAPAARLLDFPDFPDMSHTSCEQQRRARLMSMVVWQGQWVPVCDSQGNYLPHQCDNMGQCFCVETLSGKILTAKTLGAVDCSTQPEVTPEVTTTMTPTKAPAARLLDFPDFPDMSHTSCEQQRRARLMSMVVWQGQWVPVCDSQGNYLPHQCDNMGMCFCVEPEKGTLLTAKTQNTVDCTGHQR